jgi:hypothetical protein
MHPIPARIFLLFLSFPSLVAAVDFTQCLEIFKSGSNFTIGGVDSLGNPTSPAAAVGLTYQTCVAQCGSGAGSFSLNEFTQSFSSWLLPWLALTSKLPFGSENYVDDLVSGLLSLLSTANLTTYPNTFMYSTSCHKRWLPCAGRILPRSHFPKQSISLSQGEAHHSLEQNSCGGSVDISSTSPSRAYQR